MRIIRRKSILLSCAISLMYSSGLVATFISILTLVFTGYHLTPLVAFTLLSIINVLRNSALRSIGEGSQFVYEAYVSFDRIQEFLLLPNLHGLTDAKLFTTGDGKSLVKKKGFENGKANIKYHYTCLQETLKKTAIITKFLDIPHNKNQHPFAGMTNLVLGQTDEPQIVEEGQFQEKSKASIKLTNVTSKVNTENICLLKSISFEADDDNFVIISGVVGSGKSTLLSVIAGEIPVTEGNIQCCGTIAYVPQMPWVFSGTLRENILFGRPFDFDKYTQTIRACALEEDIEGFPDKDQVIVGDRGETLSGGQQVRISLARAVYADYDFYLLDNPLAALDMNVSNHIFKHCILGLLSSKVRLMVSHQESHMKVADQVIVMRNGTVIDKGTFMELNEKEALKEILEPQSNAVQETDLYHEQIPSTKDHFFDNKTFKSMEIPDEDRKIGAVSCTLYWNYLTAGEHPIALAGLFLIFLLSQGKSQKTVCIDDAIKKNPILKLGALILIWSVYESKSFRKIPTRHSYFVVPQVHRYSKQHQFRQNQLSWVKAKMISKGPTARQKQPVWLQVLLVTTKTIWGTIGERISRSHMNTFMQNIVSIFCLKVVVQERACSPLAVVAQTVMNEQANIKSS